MRRRATTGGYRLHRARPSLGAALAGARLARPPFPGESWPMSQSAAPARPSPAGAPAPTDQVVIATEALTKVYPGNILAVDHLDLSVDQGEIFGLLGPNGAGKTTTAGMLTTRVLPTSGSAVVGGIDVVAHPALAKQAIGVVPQQNTLDRSLSVWENLYFHGRFFGMSR